VVVLAAEPKAESRTDITCGPGQRCFLLPPKGKDWDGLREKGGAREPAPSP
jgi:hypothetical protein